MHARCECDLSQAATYKPYHDGNIWNTYNNEIGKPNNGVKNPIPTLPSQPPPPKKPPKKKNPQPTNPQTATSNLNHKPLMSSKQFKLKKLVKVKDEAPSNSTTHAVVDRRERQ